MYNIICYCRNSVHLNYSIITKKSKKCRY